MAFFGLKLGLDLEMRAAHPHQKFQGVPPPPRGRVYSQDSVNTGTSQTVNRAHLMTGVRLLITVCTCSRA